jgi:four helix bundle protein
LRRKTFDFALRIVEFHDELEQKKRYPSIAGQILRSGTSIGAQYREACRARSKAEFISKLGGCLQEADETLYWIELLHHSGKVGEAQTRSLHQDCSEIVRMIVRSIVTVKGRPGKRDV